MSQHTYVGNELELFAEARRWKEYWISRVRPCVRGSVLEVGAGLGANTRLLRQGTERRWVCLEPDAALAATLRENAAQAIAPETLEIRIGTLAALGADERFDCVLYIDVLEHIEDDRAELQRAAGLLAPGGCLVVLSPAHQWLFSPFDQAIGHWRRYTRRGLEALTPPGLRLQRAYYLDSVGMLASAANRLLLRQSMPNARQIRCWDRCFVPCSRWLDPLTGHRLGKSVVAIWERPAASF